LSKDRLKSGQIAFLILAHNEAAVIERAVESVCQALSPQDKLYVVADNCSDDTATRAHNAGAAEVFVRGSEPLNGKGVALAWFVKHHWERLTDHAAVVILDADNRISPEFSRILRDQLTGRDEVLQCFIQPVDYENSPLSTLIALSELLEQLVPDQIRTTLGWPVRLRGTGMVISPIALQQVCEQVQTEVEDIALSLLFTARGIKIKRLDAAIVYDPKPGESLAAARQRARWFRGQWAALWHYRTEVWKIVKQGLSGWSLLSSLFIKPRWLVTASKIILAVLCSPLPALAIFFWLAVLLDLVFFSIGLLLIEKRTVFLKAIIYFPLFVMMWLRSFILAFQRSPWMRVRE